MDETQSTPTASQTELTDLQEQCQWMRKQMQTMLILLVIVSGTLCLFLWRQVRYTSADLVNVRPQAEQMIAEYNKMSAPSMDSFVRSIVEYGRTHPDFVPIMTKFGLTGPAPASPAPPKAAATVPAATPAAKK